MKTSEKTGSGHRNPKQADAREPAARRAEPVGLIDFQAKRKASSREKLLAAATEAFCSRGYFNVSVEEIVSAAGVSRMTFYRHFNDKAALAAEMFRLSTRVTRPQLVSIGQADFRDRDVVKNWLGELFTSEQERRQLLQVFLQANVSDENFTARGHEYLDSLAVELGRNIPAFNADPEDPNKQRQWVEGWLILYEILDQGNHAARHSGVAVRPETLDVLTDRFITFVRKFDQ